MNSNGFSKERLERIETWANGVVERGERAGMVTLIARHGAVVHWEAFGMANREKEITIQKDSLFSLFSMTKPIVSAAFMQLVERGLVRLSLPLHKLIPAFKDVKVLDGMGKLVAPEKPITLHHLLTHTSGLSYGFDPTFLVDKLYNQAGIWDSKTGDEFCRKLASLPLRYQPGTQWHYSMATDVIGHLIPMITGKSLGEYLMENFFDPLGMEDTAFHYHESQAARLASIYTPTPDGSLQPFRLSDMSGLMEPDSLESGGGGLAGSTHDYFRFAQMMLNDGELGGRRYLSPQMARWMHQNHLPPNNPYIDNPGFGFGIGFDVALQPGAGNSPVSPGTYSWGGAAHTKFWIDPVKDLVALFMVQYMDDENVWLADTYAQLVYQAMEDED